MERVNFSKAYVGYNGLPEDMVIYDTSGYDVRKSIAAELMEGGFTLRKALSTTLNTYSAGNLPVLIPVYVDPEIVDLTRRATPLVELIPRVTNYGKTADYNQITAIATAQAVAEGAALNEQNDSYVRMSVPIKYLVSVGSVTGPMFAASKQYLASGGYVDALSLEVKNKTIALKRLEEAMILLGQSNDWVEPVNNSTVSGANSFLGLYSLITSPTYNGSSDYATDLGGAPLSINAIRNAIWSAQSRGGEPNLIVCDLRTYNVIKSLIQDELRYISTTDIAWGITTVSFEGIPIIASRFLSTASATNTGQTPISANPSSSLFVLDTNVIEMRVLQDVSYMELAMTYDAIKFALKLYEALVVKAPQFNQIIYGIG